jgi:LPXTG-motif cell wall-anchored protein
MEAADLSAVFFDRVFEQAYTTQTSVLESLLRRNEIPLLLVQGIFSEEATVDVQQTDSEISLESGENLLEIWQFRTSEPDRQSQIRLQLPDNADPEAIRILIRQADGTWRAENGHVLGRYAVAPLISGDDAIAVVQTGTIPWLPILAVAGLIVLAGIFLIRKRKTKE